MRIVSWTWFYYVLVGFIMAGGLSFVLYWAKEKGIKIKNLEWAGIIAAELTFMFMMQTFIASFEEYAVRAAWLTIVFMGIPLMMICVATLRSIQKRLN